MGSLPFPRVEFSTVGAADKAHARFQLRGLPCPISRSRSWSPALVRASKGPKGKRSTRDGAKAASKKKGSPWDDPTDDFKGANRTSRSTKSSKPKAKVSRSPALEDARVLLSGAMPVELEEVLQTGEPAATPLWQTFTSSLCGVWKGVGAAFSPTTAEMEAIALGSQDEMLYDCRIVSTVEECRVQSLSCIRRKTMWAVGNALGEQGKQRAQVQETFLQPQELESVEDSRLSTIEDIGVEIVEGSDDDFIFVEDSDLENELFEEIDLDDNVVEASNLDAIVVGAHPENSSTEIVTADLENPNLVHDTMMEENDLELEPGLVFFEDGSYSRGPLILLLDGDHSLTDPSYQIEQCLVRGGHSRLRIVHTIAVEDQGESIQLLRVAVYNEEWMGPHNMKSISDSGGHHLKLFSQHPRLKPKELVGSWKVFELSAIPIFSDDARSEQWLQRPSYVYMTTETQKRRLLPESPLFFADEDITDMPGATVMWLPCGISAYVDVKHDGTLTVGVGWYENGINLVMERDYNTEGKLSEIHSKSEVKGGWVGGRM